jgi:ribonuclease E
MTKRMLIDATHGEETRVVVLDGNRLEDFDVETAAKKQLKGNIYLAKIVRVEPSLQAAFVEYGGSRHGFLAFSEIHPDYYQIPVADRQRLLDQQAEQAQAEAEAEDAAADAAARRPSRTDAEPAAAVQSDDAEPEATGATADAGEATGESADEPPATPLSAGAPQVPAASTSAESAEPEPPGGQGTTAQPAAVAVERVRGHEVEDAGEGEPPELVGHRAPPPADADADQVTESPPPETLGGEPDAGEEAQERRIPPRFLRNYKIQEVIRRRQIMLVQVVKEERGTKGAALTTYISLAGRYCVLMPNSPRGGGISRKITSPADRRRLKEITAELDIPKGMGLIVRTAGANRPKSEITRDCDYLMRLWDDIRETTLRSVAPALVYEEASLIKRAIRDIYSRDIDEVLVDGEQGWRAAHEVMRMLMPTHAKKVILWNDPNQSLLVSHQVEAQLDAMLLPTMPLRSGGYLVINQTEALVAIDVNSGRATRERNIEETALRTNLEAAEEIARQLRLRDLAGLIVIDFIDMEAKKHNLMVERRLKEALKNDRARLQVGHISHFGLLEMSRQRLRPSLAETSFVLCPSCGGTGHVRSIESAAIHVLRGIEEEATARRAAELRIHVAGPIALYILNNKRDRLGEIEAHYGIRVVLQPDDALIAPQMRIERLRPPPAEPTAAVTAEAAFQAADHVAEEAEDAEEAAEEAGEAAEEGSELAENHEVDESAAGDETDRRRRRRRRRRRGSIRRDDVVMPENAEQPDVSLPGAREPAFAAAGPPAAAAQPGPSQGEPPPDAASAGEQASARRRVRRGGRRRPSATEGRVPPPTGEPMQPFAGATPADPFGGAVFDLYDAIEGAEQMPQGAPLHAPPLPLPEPAPLPNGPLGEPEPMPAETAAAGELTVSEEAPAAQIDTAVAAAEAEPTAAPATSAEPEPPAAEPLVKPYVIGIDAPAAEKKRGWWRR